MAIEPSAAATPLATLGSMIAIWNASPSFGLIAACCEVVRKVLVGTRYGRRVMLQSMSFGHGLRNHCDGRASGRLMLKLTETLSSKMSS